MKRISWVVLAVLLVLVSAGLACGVGFYWHYIGNLLEKDLLSNVTSAGQETAISFTRAVEADQRVIDTIAINIQTNYPWTQPKKLERFLQLQVKYNEFANLGIIPLKGKPFLAREADLTQTWQKEILDRALEEDTFISDRQADPLSRRGVFVQGASLHNGEDPIGALFAFIPTRRYHTLLTLSSLGGSGYAIVINRDGNVEAAGKPIHAIAAPLRYNRCCPGFAGLPPGR